MNCLQDGRLKQSITIHTAYRDKALGDLFGIFFEDINRAADGGLYGELVENGAFEFAPSDNKDYTPLTAWEKVGGKEAVELLIQEEASVNTINPHYLKMSVNSAGGGVQNIGYNTGISLKAREKYIFSCYARTDKVHNNGLMVQLLSKTGEVYEKQPLNITDKWEKYEMILESSNTDHSGRLAIVMKEAGEVCLDFISLFPCNTFKNRRNGMRRELAQAVADMKPKFMRFPGGCLVHCGTLCAEDRKTMYRWKNTLGKVEERPAKSSIWKYHQSLGLGYFEYFQFCEDIGAKPIPIIPAGFDPHIQEGTPLEHMQEWIDEALDLIEFATGDINSKWGSIRGDMGHREPFELEYIGIGNEEQGEGFFERYAIIHQAIKGKYPQIKIINSAGPFAEGGDYERGWESARKENSDIIDEHYYQSPEWFIANHHRYDDFKETDPKVFLGEYASEGNGWFHALSEASYMIGLEKNAGKVALACYAPLFSNVDYVNWPLANLIWYNNYQVLLTPSYYIQKLFMNHQGNWQLLCDKQEGWTEDWTTDGEFTAGEIYFGSNGANVEYRDILIQDSNNKVINEVKNCTVEKNSEEFYAGNAQCKEYSISFQATQKEEEGAGFSVHFGRKDKDNLMSLILGGWNKANNTLHEVINGKPSCLSQYPFPLKSGKTYSVRIDVAGRQVTVTIDGVEYQKITRKHILVEPLYYCASEEESTGDVILKVVNLTNKLRNLDIKLEGEESFDNGTVYSMWGYSKDSQNILGEPNVIEPKQEKLKISDNRLCYEIQPESFTVFRVSKNS